MALSTADSKGRPSVRIVLLKGAEETGFIFYTHRASRKGRQLEENPRAALCFFRDASLEQVLIEGSVRPVSKSQSDAYWITRPRESQLGAWASHQSAPLDRRETLLRRFAAYKKKFRGRSIPRPPGWIGYRLLPDRIEFWKAQPFRLNERILYQNKKGRWTKTLLYP